jgi:hypothetical protein
MTNKNRANTGVLRCAQDDVQRKKQIPSLRCGMTSKKDDKR